jgi:glycosyltransferase involved in cell wall biosynthesis
MKLSIIGPMYNEGKNVDDFVETVLQTQFPPDVELRIILVDDGSTDDTWTRMLSAQSSCNTRITLVKLSKNFGLESAIKAGLTTTFDDAAVVMDADLQDPPEVILSLLAEWRKGSQIVHAVRATRMHDSLAKRFFAKIYYSIQSVFFSELNQLEGAANFKLLTRQVIDTYITSPKFYGIFRIAIPGLPFPSTTVRYNRYKRNSGKTKFNFVKTLKFLGEILISSTTDSRKVPFVLIFMLSCISDFLVIFQLFSNGISVSSASICYGGLLAILLSLQLYYFFKRRNLIAAITEERPQFVIDQIIESKVT